MGLPIRNGVTGGICEGGRWGQQEESQLAGKEPTGKFSLQPMRRRVAKWRGRERRPKAKEVTNDASCAKQGGAKPRKVTGGARARQGGSVGVIKITVCWYCSSRRAEKKVARRGGGMAAKHPLEVRSQRERGLAGKTKRKKRETTKGTCKQAD